MKESLALESDLQAAIGWLRKMALSDEPLAEKLGSALQHILSAGPAAFLEQGCIFLVDDQTGNLVIAAEYNLDPAFRHECTIVPLGHCLCGRVAKERRTIFLRHGAKATREPHGQFCAPITDGERLLGVLNLYTSSRYRLTGSEELFLAAATQSLAVMIILHRKDDELLAQRNLLRKILDHLPYRIFWKDRNALFLGGNLRFALDAGVAVPEDLIGRSDNELPARRDDADTYLRRDQWVLQEGQPLLDYEELRRVADGREIMVMGSLLPLHDSKGGVSGVVGIYDDVTAQREAEIHLRNLALNDQLTGLPNQTLFRDRVGQAILAAQRLQQILGIVCLDLDNFKKVNNTLGHTTGDEVLRLTGRRLQKAVFDGDTVGRMGGDSFVVLLKSLRSEDDITLVLRKLRQALEQPFMVGGHEVFVTASLGIALYPHDGEDPPTLLKNADTALHQAKEKGRNGYQLYSPSMNASALMRLSMESQLRRALELQQFSMYYQPQVDARSGRLVGAEALIRWHHPELGLVAPGDFIALAEETGLIVDIGAWAIDRVCHQARQWQELGLQLERVAVNLSPRQFQHHDIVTTVCAALLDSGLDPQHLELEITESAVMYDSEQAAAALSYFREMGVRIAIDDFGTGYSSLIQLKRFPITLLKIDRSFVQGIGSNEDDKAIVTAVIAMAKNLGLKVLAEGVESRQHWDFLRDNGCDELQGYLFSRPLAADQFEELLSRAAGLDKENAGFDKIFEKTA